MRTIFKIEGVFIDKEDDTVGRFGSVLTDSSINDIKSYVLPEYIDKTKELFTIDGLHHIDVTEIPLNKMVEDGEFVSMYTFLPDGTLYMSKEYNNLWGDANFKGRNPEELPLKVGDKIMWPDSDSVHFGVVYGLPPKIGKFDYLDAFDDSYTVLEGFDEIPENLSDEEYMLRHQHIDVNHVFKIE